MDLNHCNTVLRRIQVSAFRLDKVKTREYNIDVKKFTDIDYPELVGDKKPTLLLHVCCAPCAAGCIERILEFFEVTFFYYNPNITDTSEYVRRLTELERFASYFGIKTVDGGKDDFSGAVKGLENEPEGGARCAVCFRMRLEKTAEKAAGYDYFATTLTLSPLKNAALINAVGAECAAKHRTRYVATDFKKKNGVLASVRLSEKYSLYRQNYCGCVYSRRKD